MSVKGCYTDFHIDFGGTSVWYHVFKGSKVSSTRFLLSDMFTFNSCSEKENWLQKSHYFNLTLRSGEPILSGSVLV